MLLRQSKSNELQIGLQMPALKSNLFSLVQFIVELTYLIGVLITQLLQLSLKQLVDFIDMNVETGYIGVPLKSELLVGALFLDRVIDFIFQLIQLL